MGTSQSSEGPSSGVPLVPPWVEDPPGDGGLTDADTQMPEAPEAPALAPTARFGGSRRALGDFAESGDRHRLRQGLSRYTRRGLGGSRTAASRMAGTARAASALYSILGGESRDAAAPSQLDRSVLAGRSAQDVIKAILDAIRPVDGSDDAEATRNSANDALTELIDQFGDADLLDLTEQQRIFVLERFVSMDVFRRFMLDLGKHILDRAPSSQAGAARISEARDYIRETVIASFRRKTANGTSIARSQVVALMRRTLLDAFDVFAEYAE